MSNQRARITDRDPLTPTDGVLSGYEQASQLTSQQSRNTAIQQVEELNSEEAPFQTENDNPESQEADKLKSQPVKNTKIQLTDKSIPASQQVEKSNSQESDKPTTRKATYQIDDSVLDALDRYHLQLQIDMGKRKAPYKEIVVEEAIAQWLERVEKSPDRAVKTLLKRQEQRQ
jgi:hypothetical protein